MSESTHSSSPHWGLAPKLIFGLTFVTIAGWFIIKFRNLLGPLILIFLVTYILYPVAKRISRWTKMSWGLAVTLIYLLLIVIILGLLTLGGLALVNQLQSLVTFLQNTLNSLPTFINSLASATITIGPFKYYLHQVNISSFTSDLLSQIQPLLGKVGNVLGIIASGAATTVGWIFFVIIVSYFILIGSSNFSGISHLHVPGYDDDIQRLTDEVKHIWKSFIRGQLTITGFAFITYSILFGIFGLPFCLGLALIGALAKFIPYVGAFCVWTTLGIVAYLKGVYPFGLSPMGFAILVVGCAMLLDSITDNFISPRIMGSTLRVNPAAVLISAIIAIDVIGIVGVMVAAPILATLQLFFGYTLRKMIDQDPWEGVVLRSEQNPSPFYRHLIQAGHFVFKRIEQIWQAIMSWIVHRFHPRKADSSHVEE